MKKIFLELVCGCIICSVVTSNAKAQNAVNKVFGNNQTFETVISMLGDYTLSNSKNSELDEASVNLAKANFKALRAKFRATKDFTKMYKNGSDVNWSIEGKLIVASFKRNQTQTMVVYKNNGRWFHTLLFYNESQMPNEIRSIVKGEYSDCEITGVQEIREADSIYYVVHLQDRSTIRNVCVYNGEMKVLEEFQKSH